MASKTSPCVVSSRAPLSLADGTPVVPGQRIVADLDANEPLIASGELTPIPSPPARRTRSRSTNRKDS